MRPTCSPIRTSARSSRSSTRKLAVRPELRAPSRRLHAYLTQALGHLGTAAAVLSSDPWQESYELTRIYHAEAAEAAYLARDYAAAEQLSGVVLEKARDLLDAVPAYETRIYMHHARREEEAALRIALDVLGRFGVEIPMLPEASDLRSAVLAADRAAETVLAEVRKEGIEKLPVMRDPAQSAVARLLMPVALIAGWARARLMRLAMCRLIELTTTHGVGPISPIAWVLMADVRCSELEDLAGGRRAGEFALELAELSTASGLTASARVLFDLLIGGRTVHPKDLMQRCSENYRQALESGDLLLATTSCYQSSVAALLGGAELAQAEVFGSRPSSQGSGFWSADVCARDRRVGRPRCRTARPRDRRGGGRYRRRSSASRGERADPRHRSGDDGPLPVAATQAGPSSGAGIADHAERHGAALSLRLLSLPDLSR